MKDEMQKLEDEIKSLEEIINTKSRFAGNLIGCKITHKDGTTEVVGLDLLEKYRRATLKKEGKSQEEIEKEISEWKKWINS